MLGIVFGTLAKLWVIWLVIGLFGAWVVVAEKP